jgi:hypothetical protein
MHARVATAYADRRPVHGRIRPVTGKKVHQAMDAALRDPRAAQPPARPLRQRGASAPRVYCRMKA